MPKSSKRRKRRMPVSPDRRRAAAAARPRRLSDGDLVCAAHVEENQMRWQSALDLLLRLSPRTPVPGWASELGELVIRGERTPPWVFAQWLGRAGCRWAAYAGDEARLAPLAWSFARGHVGAGASTDDAVAQLLNPWVVDAWLFDRGAFDRYLREVAPVGVVDLCPEVRDWTCQPLRLLRCTGSDHGTDQFEDELGEVTFAVRRRPTQAATPEGQQVVARPLPAPGGGSLLVLPGVVVEGEPPGPLDLRTWTAWLSWLGRTVRPHSDKAA